MRKRARPLNLNHGNMLDTAGTGGDGAGTFNISTGCGAGCGGGRRAGRQAWQSRDQRTRRRRRRAGAFGHQDRIWMQPGSSAASTQANCCFVFAPAYHPVLARLAAAAPDARIRTVFNLMAPMANPARPRRQLLGVAEPKLLRPMAEALAALGVDACDGRAWQRRPRRDLAGHVDDQWSKCATASCRNSRSLPETLASSPPAPPSS